MEAGEILQLQVWVVAGVIELSHETLLQLIHQHLLNRMKAMRVKPAQVGLSHPIGSCPYAVK